MKTIKLKLYTVKELSKEAFKKAHEEWIKNNDYFFLEEYLTEQLKDLLKENKITNDSNDVSIGYSLSYCQGDGVMFSGHFEWNGYTVKIEHEGRYYHSNSKVISIEDKEGNTVDTNEPYEVFEKIYQTICKELEKDGYNYIEHEDSEENFVNMCEMNNYTFEVDGTIRNN